MSQQARSAYASSQTSAPMQQLSYANGRNAPEGSRPRLAGNGDDIPDERSVANAHKQAQQKAVHYVSGVYVAEPASTADDARRWITYSTRRVHPSPATTTREPQGAVVQVPTTQLRRRELTWTDPQRPETAIAPEKNITSWTRPLTSPVKGNWKAERSALMQFIGNDGDQQRRTQEEFDHDFDVIKMLALRVRTMSTQEREDLYSAMRTIVKMAESMPDSEASDNAQAREDAMFQTLINRSSPSRAVTARVDRKSSDEVQDILDELEGEAIEKLHPSLQDGLLQGANVLNGGAHEMQARTRSKSTRTSGQQGVRGKNPHLKPPFKTPSVARLPTTLHHPHVSSSGMISAFRIYAGQVFFGALKPGQDWRRDRDSVARAICWCNMYLATAALAGTIAACLQHEAVMRGSDPRGGHVNVLKAVNTVSSAAVVGFVYRASWLEELFARIRFHLRLLVPLDPNVPPMRILSKLSFWLQALLCFIHLPPFITFEWATNSMDNFVLYRGETILMALNMLRLYLFCNVFVDQQLVRLPKRHTVSGFTGVLMNSAFVCKHILNSKQAFPIIILVWVWHIFFLGYLFRAFENTACQFGNQIPPTNHTDSHFESTALHPGCQNENAVMWLVIIRSGVFEKINDTYLWDGFWFIFSATTTAGWGDLLPTTHLGRVMAGLANAAGITSIGMLTSALMMELKYTPEEESAVLMLETEKAKRNMPFHAARLLQMWYRDKRSYRHPGSTWAKTRYRLYQLKTAFKRCKELRSIEYQDLVADGVRIDRLARQTKYLKEAAEVVERLTAPGFFAPVSQGSVKTPIYEEPDEDKMTSFEFAALSKLNSLELQGGKASKLEQTSQTDQIVPESDGCLSSRQAFEHLILKARMITKAPKLRWRFNRILVEQRLVKINLCAAACGITSVLCSIIVHELMISGQAPDTVLMMLLKSCSSLSTVATIVFVYQNYRIHFLKRRLSLHLRQGLPYDPDVTVPQVLFSGKAFWFWFEVLVCAIHVPPVMTAIEFSSSFMGNEVFYRLETVGCAGNVLKVYLLWRPIVDYILKGFPSKHNISALTHADFNSTFVVKWMMNGWHAGLYIAIAWIALLLVMSYLYRLAEHMHSCLLPGSRHPGCQQENAKMWTLFGANFEKQNDLYFWNSCWFIHTCITPGAGGNIAVVTHFGRIVAAVAVSCGVFMGSLVTAAIGNLMILTPAEHTVRGILHREASRKAFTIAAVNIISLWWRKKRSPHMITKNQMKMHMHGYRRVFVVAENKLHIDIEDCSSMSNKLEQIALRTKAIRDALDRAGLNIFRSLKMRSEVALVLTSAATQHA